MMKKLISLLLAVIIVFSAVATAGADTLSDLKNEQQRLEQEAAEYEEIIKDKENEIAEQEEYVNAIAEKVANVNSQIALNREKIAAYDARIAEQEAEKDRLNAQAEENMNVLRKRLRAIYMAGDTSALEIILGAKDFTDFVDKMQLVESISDYDAKLVDELEAQLDNVNQVVESLNSDKAELEVEKASLEENQSELNSLLAENEEALATLYGQKADAEDHMHAYDDAIAEVNNEIEAYYESLKQQQNQNNSGSSGGSYDTPVYSGNYVWPAPGYYTLTSQFYEPRTGYYHGGIDIAGSGFMGTTIVAAASGTVITSNNSCSHNWGKYGSCGCGGGFGNYVWIDHGGGKATIYAHLSYTTVYEGQYVTAGEVLGYGGSTGYSTGPHLHFECRYYGTKYDPMTELS
ncbi:MAG: peptidoglycan DD-metalloendopeptidase family protein [Ruminococcus sp.]|nr:peptidoglycan DD-metalloendopeptidase family protein [Ruminococcus sp.]